MSVINRKIVLAKRPEGTPQVDDFGLVEEELGPAGEGEVIVQVEHLSIDAFISTMLDRDGHHGKSALNMPVMALGTGRVVESRVPELAVGDAVFGGMRAQQYCKDKGRKFRKLPDTEVPTRAYLGALGMTTGLTAYAGMLIVGEAGEGDTVAVSGAAGAVGIVASQLAKIRGARVIGIAGGPEKCAFLEAIGCDDTIDYKHSDVGEQLKTLAPDGLDVFFDNVGGDILDNALDDLAPGARVVICGAISQYGNMDAVKGPSLYLRIAERNASMRGFTVDYYAAQFPEMEADLAQLLTEGRLQMPEHIETGIENFPKALMMLFSGGHTGKLLVAL